MSDTSELKDGRSQSYVLDDIEGCIRWLRIHRSEIASCVEAIQGLTLGGCCRIAAGTNTIHKAVVVSLSKDTLGMIHKCLIAQRSIHEQESKLLMSQLSSLSEEFVSWCDPETEKKEGE